MKLTCWTNLLILSSFISFERGRLVKGSSRGLYHIDQWHCHFSEFCEFWVILVRFCKNWWVFKRNYLIFYKSEDYRTDYQLGGHLIGQSDMRKKSWLNLFSKSENEKLISIKMEPNKELFEKIIKHQRRCSSSVFVDFWPNCPFFHQFLSKNSPFLP